MTETPAPPTKKPRRKKKKTRRKKKKWTKKDRIAKKKRREENEKRRVKEALEKTVRSLAPHNHIVHLSQTKYTKETILELKDAFSKVFGKYYKKTPDHGNEVQNAFNILSSVFENHYMGIRISKTSYLIPGTKALADEIKHVNTLFMTWNIYTHEISIPESAQFEPLLIDKVVDVKNEFLERARSQKRHTKFTTSAGVRWMVEKITWLRTLANATGSAKAHRVIDQLSHIRDKYAKEFGYNLPLYVEIQKVLTESYDTDFQKQEVLKWVDWGQPHCILESVKEGSVVRRRIEKYTIKLINAFSDSPQNEARYMTEKAKADLLRAADRYIMPNFREVNVHPYRDQFKDYF